MFCVKYIQCENNIASLKYSHLEDVHKTERNSPENHKERMTVSKFEWTKLEWTSAPLRPTHRVRFSIHVLCLSVNEG